MQPDDRLTPAEVAPLIRHTEQTVIRWCRRGVLTPAMIGRRVFVRRSEVDRFLRDGPAVEVPKKTRAGRPKKPVPNGARKGLLRDPRSSAKRLKASRGFAAK